MELSAAISLLKEAYGPRGWWPLPSRAREGGRNEGGYLPLPSVFIGPGGSAERARDRFEIAVGAVLAQNTAWRGASKAVVALGRAGLLSPARLLAFHEASLAELLRPAGTCARKAGYLRILAGVWESLDAGMPGRQELLAIKGIGTETADCILLYCYGFPVFVADAYARRLLSRLGLSAPGARYEELRSYAEARLPQDASCLAEAHALIVEHAKRRCKAKPLCASCPLAAHCVGKPG